ncbi:MAG: hypothetical protein IPH49_14810 [Ignavibacteria bacterium]|nr:hypothetical protein [Ignavibacteria bacterium]
MVVADDDGVLNNFGDEADADRVDDDGPAAFDERFVDANNDDAGGQDKIARTIGLSLRSPRRVISRHLGLNTDTSIAIPGT